MERLEYQSSESSQFEKVVSTLRYSILRSILILSRSVVVVIPQKVVEIENDGRIRDSLIPQLDD